MSNVHIGEKNDNYSKDDIVATNQVIDTLTTCKKILCPQKEGEISSVRTQMASCALCKKSNMCLWIIYQVILVCLALCSICTWLFLEPILGNYVGATWQFGKWMIFPCII